MLLHILRGGRRDAGHPWEPKSGFPSAAAPPLCSLRPAEGEREVPWPGSAEGGSIGRRRALITDAQRGADGCCSCRWSLGGFPDLNTE